MTQFFGYDSDPDNHGISDDEDSVEEFTPRLACLAADLALRGSATTSTKCVMPKACGLTGKLPCSDPKTTRVADDSCPTPATASRESRAAKVTPQFSVHAPPSRPASALCSTNPRSVHVARPLSGGKIRPTAKSLSVSQVPGVAKGSAPCGPSTPRRTAVRSVPSKKPERPQSMERARTPSSQSRASKTIIKSGSNFQLTPEKSRGQMETCTVSSEGFTGATLEVYEPIDCGCTGGTSMPASTIYRSNSSQCSWEDVMRAQQDREAVRVSFFAARLGSAGLLSRLQGKDKELLQSGLSIGGRTTVRRWIQGSISGLHAVLLMLNFENFDCDLSQKQPDMEDGPTSKALSAMSGGFVDILGLVGQRLYIKVFRGSPVESLQHYAGTHSGTSVAEVNLSFRYQIANAHDACHKLELRIEHELLRLHAAGSQAVKRTSRQDNINHGIDTVQEEWSKSVAEVNSESDMLPAAALEARNQAVDECLMRMIRMKKTLIRHIELLERVDHYAILGVAPAASDAEVRRAYREACLRCHPDKPGGDTELFQKLQTAYTAVIEDRRLQAQKKTSDGGDLQPPRHNERKQGEASSATDVPDADPYLAEANSAIKIIAKVADEVGAATQQMLRNWNAFVDAGYPRIQALSLAKDFLDCAEKSTKNVRLLGEQAVELSAAFAALIGLAGDYPLNTEDLRAAAAACGFLGMNASFAASDVARGSIGLREAVQSWELAALLRAPEKGDTEEALGEALKKFVGPMEKAAANAVDTLQAARAAETVAVSLVQDLIRLRRQSAAAAEAKEEATKEADQMPSSGGSQGAQDYESEDEDEGWGCSSPKSESAPAVTPAGRISSRKAAAHNRRLANHRLLQQLEADLSRLQGKARGVALVSSNAKCHLSNLRQILVEVLCDSARTFRTLLGKSGSMSVEKAFTLSLGFVEAKAWGGASTLPRSPPAQAFRVAASLDPRGLARMLENEVWPPILRIAQGDPSIQQRCESVLDALARCESEVQM
eukprot:gnl/MRDRNA2_/MRDRNA2_114690_c0_seq1.p1 gnl/MRDRNA2_/MRDRNA2_114690_c0~~gnl/MRDRNA2_/MRDRNA2_114690_c0_seq1.p1  ORF type:complete len:1001 (+),score=219.36 gnl/MRDRNA2_/MRDRNA2_114690_c0_seq1:101-3103(+)